PESRNSAFQSSAESNSPYFSIACEWYRACPPFRLQVARNGLEAFGLRYTRCVAPGASDVRATGLQRIERPGGNHMSCRIARLVIGEDAVLLCISGRIVGRDVDMLRGLLEQEKSAVTIDLQHVLLVDREAIKLLALTEANGTELKNCPAYIREWVT